MYVPRFAIQSLTHLLRLRFFFSDWANTITMDAFFYGFPYRSRRAEYHLPLSTRGVTDTSYQYLVMNVCPLY